MALSASNLRSALRRYSDAIFTVSQPKIAISCASLASLSAAIVAPALRNPCAEHCSRAASRHRSLNQLPKPFAVNGRLYFVVSQVRLLCGPRASSARSSGKIGTCNIFGLSLSPTPSDASQPSAGLALDPMRDPSDAGRKLDFVHATDGQSVYNPHQIQDPVSPYEVMAGTLISASLITGLDSDLPGLVVVQVTQNVFDTVSGKILLIPQGSRLVGTYDSVVAFGQSRALLVWQRIIMPDGSSIQIDNLPATDSAGYSGLEDQVDFHTTGRSLRASQSPHYLALAASSRSADRATSCCLSAILLRTV